MPAEFHLIIMKTKVINAGFIIFYLILTTQANAQDAGNKAAKIQVSQTSEQADKQLGQKIKEQSLSRSFEKLDSVVTTPQKNKKLLKKSRRIFRNARV